MVQAVRTDELVMPQKKQKKEKEMTETADRKASPPPRFAAAAMRFPTVRGRQVDCAVGAWGGWSATGLREREIVTRPSSDGNACPALQELEKKRPPMKPSGRELHDAAQKGDLAAVQARRRLRSRSFGGRDAAASQGLLAAGAAVNERDSFGYAAHNIHTRTHT